MCVESQPRAALGRCSVSLGSRTVMSGDHVSCTHCPWLLRTPTLAACVSCQCRCVQAASQLRRHGERRGLLTLAVAQHHWLHPACGLLTPQVFSTWEWARALLPTLESFICMALQANVMCLLKFPKCLLGTGSCMGRSRDQKNHWEWTGVEGGCTQSWKESGHVKTAPHNYSN